MKIMLLAYRYPPEVGGFETVCGELAARFAARGHEVTVVTRRTKASLPREETAGGVNVLRVGEPRSPAALRFDRIVRLLFCYPFGALLDLLIRGPAPWARPLSSLGRLLSNYAWGDSSLFGLAELAEEKRIAAEMKPDVIHGLDMRSAFHALALREAAEKAGGKRVAVLAGAPGLFGSANLFRRGFEKLAFSLPFDGFTIHNDGTGGEAFAEMMGVRDRTLVYVTGVDAGEFNAETRKGDGVRKELGIRDDEFIFGFLARVHKFKGAHRAAEAFALLCEPNAALLFVGDAPDAAYVEGLKKTLSGASGRVIFHAAVPHSATPDYFGACDAVIYCGDISVFNVSFSEAMVMGKNILAMRTDPYSQAALHEAGAGCIFPAGDAKAFAECMRAAMAAKRAARFSPAVTAYARTKWDWDAAVSGFLTLYSDAAARLALR